MTLNSPGIFATVIAGIFLFSGIALADEVYRIENRLDRKGDRIENRLDRKGNRIDDRLDQK